MAGADIIAWPLGDLGLRSSISHMSTGGRWANTGARLGVMVTATESTTGRGRRLVVWDGQSCCQGAGKKTVRPKVAVSGKRRDSSRSQEGTGDRTASRRVFWSQQRLVLRRERVAEKSCLSNVLSSKKNWWQKRDDRIGSVC
ncbi:hypothetical protein E2C01_052090 [Portunus trituberculatus]|uniref:Uncharacterized protein n=1 Tax=Portunus trituberculatus TaxID=210409 RepID=A0A5B7GL01_PORTR|nr:hypothetical protein [Portunus trituberculatus]